MENEIFDFLVDDSKITDFMEKLQRTEVFFHIYEIFIIIRTKFVISNKNLIKMKKLLEKVAK